MRVGEMCVLSVCVCLCMPVHVHESTGACVEVRTTLGGQSLPSLLFEVDGVSCSLLCIPAQRTLGLLGFRSSHLKVGWGYKCVTLHSAFM